MARISKTGLAAAAVAALVAGVPAADAQFRLQFGYCDQLQSQYLSAVDRAGGSATSGRRMVQMDQISRQLAQMQAAAQRYGCNGGFLFFGPRPSPQCPVIMANVNKLSRQLAQLRGQGFGFFDNPRFEVARLRDMLNEYGCGVPYAGGYRTLCVRACDGYYFPIESQASSGRFRVDAAVCQSMYAEQGQAELFIQSGGSDVADATSMAGARYGDQPYAFLYRDRYAPACATQLHDGIAALKQRYFDRLPPNRRSGKIAKAQKLIPLPQLRRPLTEDPETIANADGGFTLKPVAPAVAMNDAPAGKSIRMIGPAYYADLFDLSKAPKPASLRPVPDFSLVGPAAAEEARPQPEPAAEP
jgi:hypothetical protein